MAIALTNIGTNSAKTSTAALTIPIPAGGVPAGALILVGRSSALAASVTPSDTVNTYRVPAALLHAQSTFAAQIAYAYNATALTNANSISVTPSASDTFAISACYATGIQQTADPLDASGSGGATSSTAPSAATTAATTVAGELVMGLVTSQGPSGDTFTQDSTHEGGFATPFTRVGTTGGSATSNTTLAGGSATFASTGTATYAPTLGTARLWSAVVATFKPAPPSTPLTASNLASGAAGLGTPVLTYVPSNVALTANNLASGAAGLDTPALSIIIALSAANLAAGAAGLDTPLATTRLYIADPTLDNGLNAFLSANRITLCSSQPLNYADATATYKIGDMPMGIGGVIASGPSNASPDGRAVVTNAVVSGGISVSGTGAAWAIVDDANSRLLASGPLSPSIAFVTTDGWNLASMQINVRASSP